MTPATSAVKSTAAIVQARAVVDNFLCRVMIPDPIAARAYTAADMRIRFTGGREMRAPADTTAFNDGRYAGVRKRFERTDVVAGASDDAAVVEVDCSVRVEQRDVGVAAHRDGALLRKHAEELDRRRAVS